MQESVLLFVLRAEKNRVREREKSKQYSLVKADGVNLICHLIYWSGVSDGRVQGAMQLVGFYWRQ